MSSSTEVATAGEPQSTSGSLSDAQLAECWARIVANLDVARRMAGRFVSRQSVEDVVHSAAVLFVEDAQRSKAPEPFPTTEDRFRRKFLTTVRNHALDCVRDSKRPACPIHSHWGIDPEPVVGGHNVADRELDTLFARNDHRKYDAPATAELRAQDDVYLLRLILRCHLPDLPPMQAQIILETFGERRKRAEVARRLGISVKTYDCHLQAAFHTLRQRLTQDADEFTPIDRSCWYDFIEELRDRYELARLRRASRKKANVPAVKANVPTLKAKAARTRARVPQNQH